MFNEFNPNVKCIIVFLKILKIRVNKTTVNETLQNHPDWPGLLCITDSLTKWNIPNGAGKIEPNLIEQLPTPFIAYTNNIGYPLAIVSQITNNTVEVYSKNYDTPITTTIENFIRNWNGIYLLAEPTEQSGEKDYAKNKRKNIINSFISTILFALLLIFSFLLLQNNRANGISSIAIYIQYIILLSGVIVSSLLLWYEIDKNNPLLNKVCTGIKKGNCNAILSGKASKVFSWLSWSEVGFFYFAGGLLSLLFVPQAITIIAWANILALPYTIFSIYYQSSIAKQWCILCLVVQALLLSGGINVMVNNIFFSYSIFTISFFIKITLFYLLPIFLWYTLKSYILRLQEAKTTKKEYLRIKFNTEIFGTLLEKQKSITIPVNDLGIDIGNPHATNTLIKVCNPYCGPCAKAHPKIERIIEENKNVKAKIIFSTPNDSNHLSFMPTAHLMAIAQQNNKKLTILALDDWYLADKKDYEVFKKKYPMNGELLQQAKKIEAMDEWCKEMNIQFTPTIFVNGQQLPDAYSIEDLQYFLLE